MSDTSWEVRNSEGSLELGSNQSFFCGLRVEGSEIQKTIQYMLVMTVLALISVKGIRNSERLFVNTKLCSYIVRLAQWKSKILIVDGIVLFFIFFRWNAQLCLDWQNSSVRYGCSALNFSISEKGLDN